MSLILVDLTVTGSVPGRMTESTSKPHAPRSRISSTQTAWITETVVAATVIAQSNGRLSPFAPLADDHGMDLLVYDKETAATIGLQVKAWARPAMKNGTVQFDTGKSTFKPHATAFVVGLYMPLPSLSIEHVWLVPSTELPKLARDYPEKYAMVCSTKPDTQDGFRRWRMASSDMVSGLLSHFAGFPPTLIH